MGTMWRNLSKIPGIGAEWKRHSKEKEKFCFVLLNKKKKKKWKLHAPLNSFLFYKKAKSSLGPDGLDGSL